MKPILFATLAALALSGAAAQAGDAVSGEQVFVRACRSCHMIQTPDGADVVRGGRTGPNLWGVVGRAAGAAGGFSRYSASVKAAGAAGLVWGEAAIAAYVQDPRVFIRQAAGDPKARSNMSYRLSDAAQAADVAAFLALQR